MTGGNTTMLVAIAALGWRRQLPPRHCQKPSLPAQAQVASV